ncbi:MAG: hypothetical protein V1734_05310 [Nanoarchaeota archaeon]
MVKKMVKEDVKCCSRKGSGVKGLYLLGAVLFGALGFACMLQGILMQVALGFSYGFIAYLLGLLFLSAAKCFKWKLHEHCGCMPMHHMMRR